MREDVIVKCEISYQNQRIYTCSCNLYPYILHVSVHLFLSVLFFTSFCYRYHCGGVLVRASFYYLIFYSKVTPDWLLVFDEPTRLPVSSLSNVCSKSNVWWIRTQMSCKIWLGGVSVYTVTFIYLSNCWFEAIPVNCFNSTIPHLIRKKSTRIQYVEGFPIKSRDLLLNWSLSRNILYS